MPDIRFLNQIPNAIVNLAIKELSIVRVQHQLDFVSSLHLNPAVSIMHRLPGVEQVIPEPRLVASETGQRQPRRNPHRTFGRQTSLLNFFGNGSQRQQIVVIVRSLILLDGLPPGATNKKAPG